MLESTNTNQVDTFTFRGNNGAYEVEYYKGNAKDTYLFINQIIGFLEKYKEEYNILTYISGVKVIMYKPVLGSKHIAIYNKKHTLAWEINQKQWPEILVKFMLYCEKQNIIYK